MSSTPIEEFRRILAAAPMIDLDRDERECAKCGDGVLTLSSRDWCDACESEPAPRTVPKLSEAQLARADMIAAQQHAVRAADALSRALARYERLDSPDHVFTRLRGRTASRLIAEALDRIDITNGEQFNGE